MGAVTGSALQRVLKKLMIAPPIQWIKAMKSWEVPSIQQIGTWRMRIRVDKMDKMRIGG